MLLLQKVVEAKRKLRSGLSLDICYNRNLPAVRRQANNVGKMSKFTVGASNSARTAAALKKKGIAVMEMGRNGWTVSESSIDALLEQLQIVASREDILVLQCLDSRVFLDQPVPKGRRRLQGACGGQDHSSEGYPVGYPARSAGPGLQEQEGLIDSARLPPHALPDLML